MTNSYNPRAMRLMDIQTKYIPIVGDFLNETANQAAWYSVTLRFTNENMVEIRLDANVEGSGITNSRVLETVRDIVYAKYAAKVLIATVNLIAEAGCTQDPQYKE